MSHTPGPWEVNPKSSRTVQSTTGRTVASCGGYTDSKRTEETDDENAANTALITAAPEMLEALEKFLVQFSDGPCDCDNHEGDCVFCLAEKAVKKARGEA
jgi:hypothetical protein